MKRIHAGFAALVLAGLLTATAAAQPTLTGIRATQTGADPATLTAQVDVTLYTTGSPASNTGFLGDEYSGTFTFFGYNTYVVYRILDPPVDAIHWGDGNTLDRTTIPLVAAGSPHTFRGSFSHTYPTPGTYTATVGSHGWMGYPDDVPTTGYENPRLPPVTGNAIYATSVQSYYYRSYELYPGSPATGTSIFTFNEPFAVAVTNTLEVVIPQLNVLEIPTTSQWGLVVLALGLFAAGFWFLRR